MSLRIARAYALAAARHVTHKRKGEAGEPYINHLCEVAELVAEATDGADENLIIAAVLHDTIEDTDTTYSEILALFGQDVADLVQEVTDDTSLPSRERKQRQIANAPNKSPRAKILKLCDKTSNIRSMTSSPPAHWSEQRRLDYLDWARQVIDGLRGVHADCEARFDQALAEAERVYRKLSGDQPR